MPLTHDDVAGLPDQPLNPGVNPIGELGAHVAVMARKRTTHENLMFEERLDQALYQRRRAIHKLRIGDVADHKGFMQGARFYLRLARAWHPKLSTSAQQEAAE
jgi:hypothetical protein